MLSSFNLISQESVDSFEYFVKLDLDINDDTIETYLDDLNSTMVWYHEPTGLALWRVNNYPFTTSSGDYIFDINTVILGSVKKTKVAEAEYNVIFALGDSSFFTPSPCYSPLNFSIAEGTQRNVKLCILDTGIDPDMVLASDTIYNFNLTSYLGYDYVENDGIPNDENGHGTHIAGLIHSITHGISTSGGQITFNIKKTHDNEGKGRLGNIVKALLDASDEDMDIVNMSFGFSDTLTENRHIILKTAMQYADSLGILVIASAGNNFVDIDNLNNTFIPGGFESKNLLTISSLSCMDSISSFSNYGSFNADLGVIGEKITGPDLYGNKVYLSGTSQAAAIVTALAALTATYKPTMDPSLLKCALTHGNINLPHLNNKLLYSGKPNINNTLSIYQNPISNFIVNDTITSNPGSLNYALTKACGINNIVFDPVVNGKNLIVNKKFHIDKNLTIFGNGLSDTKIKLNNTSMLLGKNAELELKNLSILKANTSAYSVHLRGKLNILNNVYIE